MQLGKPLAQGVAADEAPGVDLAKPTEAAAPIEAKSPEVVA